MREQGDKEVLSDKRIAIVCGHFAPEIGYQEVDLARAFTRLNRIGSAPSEISSERAPGPPLNVPLTMLPVTSVSGELAAIENEALPVR